MAHFERFVREDRRPPAALAAALGTLARCYTALSGEVREYDGMLADVVEAWYRLASIERVAARRRWQVVPPTPVEPSRPGAAQIDPRAVPARLLRLGPSFDTAEISVDPVRGCSGPAVRVRVDAFSDDRFPDEVDVGIRLIDRRSGEVRGFGRLGRPATPHPSSPRIRHFESIVQLPESMSAPDVRVDLFGVSGPPPGDVADCAELRRVRRATLFLSDWRALIADVRLCGLRAAPAARVRTILRRLTDEHPVGSDEPLWYGGPSRSQLTSLADLGDRAVTALLCGRGPRAETPGPTSGITGDDGGAAAVVAAVSGPGDLLAAEVAAAHERSHRR